MFGVDLTILLSFGVLLIPLALLIASVVVLVTPLVAFLKARDYGRARLVGLLAMVHLALPWIAPSDDEFYLWRNEASLLREVEALQSTSTTKTRHGLHVEILKGGVVYWCHLNWGLGDRGLLWDPGGEIAAKEQEYSVIFVSHIRGPWYVCQFT